jgi:hypothetical protein
MRLQVETLIDSKAALGKDSGRDDERDVLLGRLDRSIFRN